MARTSYGFGIERLGLLSLRAPLVVLGVVAVITMITGYGLTKLSTDAAISDLFRSSSQDYADYERLNKTFTTSEYDILLVLEGDDLLSRDNLEKLREISQEIQFVEAIKGVMSLFDMRTKPNKKGVTAPVIPADLPEGKEYAKLLEQIKQHPLIVGKFLSTQDKKGTRITIMPMTLQKDIVEDARLTSVVAEIKENIKETLGDNKSIKYHLAGTPIMQMEIRDAIKRDRLVFNVAGFTLGFIICFLFFRRPVLAFIASICPVIAVVWALGFFALIDLKLNTFMNIIPPLILVIAYSDAMHLVYSIRRRIAEGDNKIDAIRQATLNVGPACVLTSLTTSLAMLSLAITDSAVIKMFGMCAAFATIVAFLVIILVVPALAYISIGDENEFRESEKEKSQILEKMEVMCGNLARWVSPRFLVISFTSALMICMFTAMHFQLNPHYKLSDQLPDHINVVAASEMIDDKLHGSYPIHVMVELPVGADGKPAELHSNRVMSVMARTHKTIESQDVIGNVQSLELLRRWVFENFNTFKGKNFAKYIEEIPANLRERSLSRDKKVLRFTGHVPNLGADEVAPVVQKLKRDLENIRDIYPEFKFTVTGLLALTSTQSKNMIHQLNQGLMTAIVIVIILIGVAFRSYKAILLAIAPNIFPIAAAGALLYVTGNGLEYASVIGLTVAFGLAVDDSIHFLNRLYLEGERNENWEMAVYRTVERIGPVLMLTTIVLVLGLAVTILSDLPPLRLFGALSMTTLAAALAADLIILPAVILSAIRLRIIARGKEA